MDGIDGDRVCVVLGALGLTGVLPAMALWLLVPVVDAIPGWIAVSALCGALVALAAWMTRGLR